MDRRLILDQILRQIAGPNGHVYFQPPSRLEYPCIVYKLTKVNNQHADNSVYIQSKKYTITVMDWDPESEIADQVSKLSGCASDRVYASEGLNHFVFTLNF